MVFSGIQKNSLIDYPGKICCVVFVSGCNFDCPYCHNPGLVNGESPAAQCFNDTWLKAFLGERKQFLEGVVISGGEPTLQKDLEPLCESIKRQGLPVKLDTNGSRPGILRHLIQKDLLDFIAMDIKSDPRCYPPEIQRNYRPEKILESIRLVMDSGVDYEFRTTCLKPFVDEEIITRISRCIEGARCYALQQFHSVQILHPEYFQHTESQYSDADLARFQTLAQTWVEECIVR